MTAEHEVDTIISEAVDWRVGGDARCPAGCRWTPAGIVHTPDCPEQND